MSPQIIPLTDSSTSICKPLKSMKSHIWIQADPFMPLMCVFVRITRATETVSIQSGSRCTLGSLLLQPSEPMVGK